MGRLRSFFVVLLLVVTLVPTAPPPALAAEATFVGAVSSNAKLSRPSVVVPGSVQPGDQLVLVVTANKNTTIRTPGGWTRLGDDRDGPSATNPEMTSAAFTTTATDATAGATVTARLGVRAKTAVNLVAYRNAETVTTALSSVIGALNADLTTDRHLGHQLRLVVHDTVHSRAGSV